MCGNNLNTFYEISAIRSNLLVSDSIIIGGQRRQVHKIMAFKREWLEKIWRAPILTFTLCGNNLNTFYEISAIRSILFVSDSIIIGGQRRQVHKIMAYKTEWLEKNWRAPILTFTLRLTALVIETSRPQLPPVAYQETDTRPLARQYSEDKGCCCCIII